MELTHFLKKIATALFCCPMLNISLDVATFKQTNCVNKEITF